MRRHPLVCGAGPLLALALGFSSCASSTEEEAGLAPEKVEASQNHVQDLWVYERLVAIDRSGKVVDLAATIAAAFDRAPDHIVDFGKGVRFELYEGLTGRMTNEANEAREDIHMTVGFIEAPNGRALAALATPTAATEAPIGAGESVRIDLGFLDEPLEEGDLLFADFGFLQAIPFEGEPAPGSLGAVELLAARLEAGSIQYLGGWEEEEETSPTAYPNRLWRKLVRRYGNEVGEAARDKAIETGRDELIDKGHDTIVEGKLPAKAESMTRGMAHGLKDCGPLGLKCVSDFFRSFGEGAKESYEMALCNGDMGDCDPEPNPEPEPRPNPDPNRDPRRDPDWRRRTPICLKNCGGSTGDPHLVTFDGMDYDLQAVGEFVAARSDELEIQIRTAPWRDSRSVAVNTGVAIGVGGQRITFQIAGDRWEIRVDGETIERKDLPPEGMEVGGGRLYDWGHFRLLTAEGHDVIVVLYQGALDVLIEKASHELAWVGLFGDGDGEKENDFRLRDGEVLAQPLSHEDLYGRFAMDWRLTQDESLFDYADGTSTEDFADLDFPAQAMTVADLPDHERARAEAICREAGIREQPTLDDCILDWAMTGAIGMLHSAQAAAHATGGSAPEPGKLPNFAWAGDATSYRGRDGEAFSIQCSAEGTAFPVWGTDLYTDDSSVCTAAVHAGLISFAKGGEVTFEIRPVATSYEGSERNGVTSLDRGRWRGSFVFP